MTANDVLARVRETTLNAYARQEIRLRPFGGVTTGALVELYPLFQVMLNLLNTPPQEYRLGNLAVERIPIDRGTPAGSADQHDRDAPKAWRAMSSTTVICSTAPLSSR
jgi:hypothetical protein